MLNAIRCLIEVDSVEEANDLLGAGWTLVETRKFESVDFDLDTTFVRATVYFTLGHTEANAADEYRAQCEKKMREMRKTIPEEYKSIIKR